MAIPQDIFETMFNEVAPLAEKITALPEDDKIQFLGYFCVRYADKMTSANFYFDPEDLIRFATFLAPKMGLLPTHAIRRYCLEKCGWLDRILNDFGGEEKCDDDGYESDKTDGIY